MTDTQTVDVPLPEVESKTSEIQSLRLADRSDAIGSTQALVRLSLTTADNTVIYLDFDGHSFGKHQKALFSQGWVIVEDIRTKS